MARYLSPSFIPDGDINETSNASPALWSYSTSCITFPTFPTVMVAEYEPSWGPSCLASCSKGDWTRNENQWCESDISRRLTWSWVIRSIAFRGWGTEFAPVLKNGWRSGQLLVGFTLRKGWRGRTQRLFPVRVRSASSCGGPDWEGWKACSSLAGSLVLGDRGLLSLPLGLGFLAATVGNDSGQAGRSY